MDRSIDALTALGDPTRARILSLIRASSEGRARVGALADTLGLRQPTVSHHMKALFDEGLVTREPDGRRVWYAIAPEYAQRVEALLGDTPAEASVPDLDRIVRDLTTRYRGVLSPETVSAMVDESHRLLARDGAPFPLGSRTAAFASARLDALTRGEPHSAAVPVVLFVCVQNAGRSQLAGGILRQLAGDRVIVRTAGSAPAGEVRSSIAVALEEIGVAVGGEFPKPLTDDAVRAADVVVTMGCGDACPVYPGRRYLDWDLEDPVGKPLERVRVIRDDIEARVRSLLDDLLPED
ncbi:metalloregulator ArsR/SmtB family transcription factor [Planococcus sp. APC 4015]|nr:metalloregulator ArsR/SmtB family transcription factor [Planococcus sp. APC 4015]